ncbi:hypothetical protein CHUAL_002775 [Chamberlinius hualienensis]
MGLGGGGSSTSLGAGISSSGLLAAYGGGQGRHSNPPAILQRLLGPSPHDVLHLTSGLHGQNTSASQARVLLANDDLRIVTDVDLVEIQDSNTLCGCSPSGSIASIPSALMRWTEESQVLDGDSVHDCVTAIKPFIVETLEKHRDIELAERRDKRKAAEEAERKAKEASGGEKKDESTSAVASTSLTLEAMSNISVSLPDTQSASAVDSNLTSDDTAGSSAADPVSSEAVFVAETTRPPGTYNAPPSIPTWFQLSSTSSSSTTSSSSSSSVVREVVPIAQVIESPVATAISIAPLADPDSPMDFVTADVDESNRLTAADDDGAALTAVTAEEESSSRSEESISQPAEGLEEATSSVAEAVAQESRPSAEDSSATSGKSCEETANEENEAVGQAAAATTPSNSSTAVTPNTDEIRTIGEQEIPEGVDPSFLEALPANIRQEVISEQLRLQRIRQRAQAQASEAQAAGFTEVNPEFLAALPPHIQEEVLAQQRQEQQRIASQNTSPDVPVDPSTFIQTLPPSLRQQVLADMDDTVVAVLPPDLAAEAQSLRQELEAHHRQMQERIFGHNTALSNIIRSTVGRFNSGRYTFHTSGSHRGHWPFPTSLSARAASGLSALTGGDGRSGIPVGASMRLRGRQLLDHEALTCLLVLLFVDEPKLNTGRLHRVLRNLCYHSATREWVIKSLLSILEKTSECRPNVSPIDTSQQMDIQPVKSLKKGRSGSSSGASGVQVATDPVLGLHRVSMSRSQPSWLSISMDAALGCRANVFQIHHKHSSPHCPSGLPVIPTATVTSGVGVSNVVASPNLSSSSEKKDKKSIAAAASSAGHCPIYVHSQAAPVVCRHVLDTLISLAKTFPGYFVPGKVKEVSAEGLSCSANKTSNLTSPSTSSSPSLQPTSTLSSVTKDTDFWDLLVRLDSVTTPGRKGSGSGSSGRSMTARPSHLNHPNAEDEQSSVSNTLSTASVETTANTGISFESSPLGHLVAMLSHPVIKKSSALTDRLLRLLSLVSIGLNDSSSSAQSGLSSSGRAGISSASAVAAAVAEIDTASLFKFQEDPVLEQHLKLAVEVLTSKSCSEEGLEDATALLLQLSRGSTIICETVLRLLLGGLRKLGMMVCSHIAGLMQELRVLNEKHKKDKVSGSSTEEEIGDEAGGSSSRSLRGTVSDRFTRDFVVLAAPNRAQAGRELHLPSMAQLTSKTSSQAFFLRILKVIVLLRDSMKTAAKKRGQIAAAAAAAATSSSSATAASTSTSATTPAQAQPSIEIISVPITADIAMDVDATASTSSEATKSSALATGESKIPRLSEQLNLEILWGTLSDCLKVLAETSDHHAVLVLQPAVEAFFFVHASASDADGVRRRKNQVESRESQLSHIHQDVAPLSPLQAGEESQEGESNISHAASGELGISSQDQEGSSLSTSQKPASPDMEKFLLFAETHRTVLNQILRQSTVHLADGPFAMLVDHTRILDFDIKRRYFRQELDRMDEGVRREDLAVHVRREHVFEDSFRELHRRPSEEWKNRFYIVFEGEEGQDAGGLLREWYTIISREIFNPNYALFTTSPGDRVTYMINSSSHCNSNHLSYFKFVGHVIAKAIYDNKLLDCYFTRSFYKHILGKLVKYTDMESEDYSFYQGLVFLLEHDIKELDYELTFSTEVQEFGVTESKDLKHDGRNVPVTEENKNEYVRLVCQLKMTSAIKQQLNAFLEGFYDIIPKRLISIFNEQELELLISGLPVIDIDDLKANAEYYKYQANSLQIQWFWRALRSFDQADRAKFLQFVTGTSKVPLQGFAALEGMSGIQKFQIHRDDRSTDRLPSAHTCFNQLDLPAYETYDKLCTMLLKAVHECSEGFGFA